MRKYGAEKKKVAKKIWNQGETSRGENIELRRKKEREKICIKGETSRGENMYQRRIK